MHHALSIPFLAFKFRPPMKTTLVVSLSLVRLTPLLNCYKEDKIFPTLLFNIRMKKDNRFSVELMSCLQLTQLCHHFSEEHRAVGPPKKIRHAMRRKSN
jgi:hypothetical protein